MPRIDDRSRPRPEGGTTWDEGTGRRSAGRRTARAGRGPATPARPRRRARQGRADRRAASRCGAATCPVRHGDALPKGATADTPFGPVELTHLNLNDYTIEGFRLVDAPAFAVQYHPEAGPGPHDARYLFTHFDELMGGVR